MVKESKAPKEKPEEKKPEIKIQTKIPCGCGCVQPIMKTK